MDPYGWMGLEELENMLGFMCSSCRPRYESLDPQAGWRRSGRESRQTRRWYAARWSFPGRHRCERLALHTVRAYHDENIQSHAVRLCQGRAAKPGQVGQVLG